MLRSSFYLIAKIMRQKIFCISKYKLNTTNAFEILIDWGLDEKFITLENMHAYVK